MGFSGFRGSSWDPKLLISQMVSLQSIYYSTLGLLVYCTCLLFPNHGLTLQHILSYDSISVSSPSGRINASLFVINSFIMSVAIWQLVGRSKLCTDFSCTLVFYHWLLSWLLPSQYCGFPSGWMWYTLHGVCALMTTVLAEYLCIRTELKAVPISNSVSTSQTSTNSTRAAGTSSCSSQNVGESEV